MAIHVLGSVRQCCQGEVKLMWQQADTVMVYRIFMIVQWPQGSERGHNLVWGSVQFKKKNNIGTSY